MNTLSNDVRDRVILFFGGSHKFITQAQEAALFSEAASSAGSCRIDGDFIALSSIARVCSLAEFYEQNPSKRPAPEYTLFTKDSGKSTWRETRRKEGIESMIRGMEKYISSTPENPSSVCPCGCGKKAYYQGTTAPLETLKHMKEKLAAVTLC